MMTEHIRNNMTAYIVVALLIVAALVAYFALGDPAMLEQVTSAEGGANSATAGGGSTGSSG